MASVNKVIIDFGRLRCLYVEQLNSIPQVSQALGVSKSTIRSRLKECGLLRSRADAVRLAAQQGNLGSGNRGKRVVFTEEWKRNISSALRRAKASTAKGTSIKPSGYIEITRGENKGRGAHVVLMEQHICRPLREDEVVHHIDHNRSNNEITNLQLMTRAEHTRLHRMEALERKKHG